MRPHGSQIAAGAAAAVLLAAVPAGAAPMQDVAAARSTTPLQAGEPIVVTATRSPRALHDVPVSVSVVGPDEIERSPTKTLDELLRSVPSFTLFRRSSSVAADPSSQGVKLRNVGASGISRALVLVDGVPANDPFGGWVAWRSIPRIGIERVEVVPGGASALYGNYALGGVIQAFSRPIEPGQVDLSTEYGSFDTAQAAARVADKRGGIAGLLEGEYFTSDGYPVVAESSRGAVDGDTPSQHTTVSGRMEAELSPRLSVGLRGGYFHEDLNGGTTYTTAMLRRYEYSGTVRYAPVQGGGLDLSLFGHHGEFVQDRARVGPGRNVEEPSAHQEVPTDDVGASVLWTGAPLRGSGTHAIAVGADARWIRGATRETLYPPAAAVPSNPTTQRDAGGQQRLYSVFAQELYDYSGSVSASLALRYDWWQNVAGSRFERAMNGTVTSTFFGDTSGGEFSPKAGLRVRLADSVSARAAAYRSFRAPTLDELYRPFQAGTVLTSANENLAPETLHGAEFGVDVGGPQGLSGRVTAFWNEMQDPIVNVSTGINTRQRQNLGKARIQGVELDGSWRLPSNWSITAAYTLADTEVTEAPGQPQLIGKELPQAPRNLATLSLAYDAPGRFTVNVQLRYLGEQYENDTNTLPMGSATLLDAYASWQVTPRLLLYVAAENLLDRTYLVGRSGVDTIGQPRFLHGGARVRLGSQVR